MAIVDGEEQNPKAQKRAEIAAEIAMREYVEIIAAQVKERLYRYINLEVFATQKDDHTKSLSERVTYIETQLGEVRETIRWVRSDIEREREARRNWWSKLSWWRRNDDE